MKYVAYYRVSTQKQGISKLGLESQKAIVANYTKEGKLLAEFTDIESGKNNGRPELAKAIQFSQREEAILVIAKLDRLSRDVNFISGLMKSDISFTACDQPHANKFTIHIFAALAEQERDMISERTKSALKALKSRGKKLGSPQNLNADARTKGVMAIQNNALNNQNNIKASALIISMRGQGSSFSVIANKLNEAGFKTRRGKSFNPIQVIRIWNRFYKK